MDEVEGCEATAVVDEVEGCEAIAEVDEVDEVEDCEATAEVDEVEGCKADIAKGSWLHKKLRAKCLMMRYISCSVASPL